MSEQYFDLQVNGYGGVDFNKDDLTSEQLHRACERLRADGVGSILATIVTEDLGAMKHRMANLAKLRERDPLPQQLITGMHIEGPFLNEMPGYRGAHPVDAIRPADIDAMNQLLDAAAGLTRLVTLAPERDPSQRVTRMLADRGIAVAAGHTNATLDELRAAIDAGLSMFTHVGNGCPMQMDRHDNIVQRALSLVDRLWLCFIGDGQHVPYFVLANYLRTAGLERCVVVTDAVAPASLGPGRYTSGRWELDIGEDLVGRAPDGSHLVGSAVPMKRVVVNLIERVGLSEQDVRQITVINPQHAIGAMSPR